MSGTVVPDHNGPHLTAHDKRVILIGLEVLAARSRITAVGSEAAELRNRLARGWFGHMPAIEYRHDNT